MSTIFSNNGWLGALVSAELERYVPAAARARLPDDLRGAGATGAVDFASASRLLVARSLRARHLTAGSADPTQEFLEVVRQHVGLVLDLRLLGPGPTTPERQQAEVAAFLAAALGEPSLALAVSPDAPGGPPPRAVKRALRASAEALHTRFFPPGDPHSGLPLYPGAVAVLRRRLARVAASHARKGGLDPETLDRHGRFAARELVLLAEALSGLLLASGEADRRARSVRHHQVARLGLRSADLREARRRVAAPRAPEALAAQAPEAIRPFLFEQLLLAQLRVRPPGTGPARFADAFANASGLDAPAVLAAQIEAAAQAGDHQAWVEAFGEGGAPIDWQALAGQWEAAGDTVVERVSTAVAENLGALVTELRETGELGTLLAKAAAGQRLTSEERRKVRDQLVDIAKAVPALAIFAAPGGAILLPILAKLLPFNLLPSAWDKVGAGKGAPPAAAAGAAAAGSATPMPAAGGASPPPEPATRTDGEPSAEVVRKAPGA